MSLRLPVIGLAALLLSGCGSTDAVPTSTLPVKGVVTFRGRPLTSGTIVFEPEGRGREAHGEIGPDGSYALSTFTKDDGAVPGPHRVAIKGTPKSLKVPAKYAGAGSSKIEITVEESKTDYPITLE
ncbi:MAG: hypothetical protein SFX72_08380 [Isosphaeraceae bacterium]|nr:hypothetical protein [Isosphaeraceae bacterium]